MSTDDTRGPADPDAAEDPAGEELLTGSERPGEGPAGIRPGGDATVAESGTPDMDAVRAAMRGLEQAGGGH